MSTPGRLHHERHDRFSGTLLGTAIGDGLGAHFEGMASVPPGELTRLAAALFPLSYTDDTHMTLGSAESLIARGGFDGDHLAGTFARYYAEHEKRNVCLKCSGRTTTRTSRGCVAPWHSDCTTHNGPYQPRPQRFVVLRMS